MAGMLRRLPWQSRRHYGRRCNPSGAVAVDLGDPWGECPAGQPGLVRPVACSIAASAGRRRLAPRPGHVWTGVRRYTRPAALSRAVLRSGPGARSRGLCRAPATGRAPPRSGSASPCSQLRIVSCGTPMRRAISICVSPSRRRTRRAYRAASRMASSSSSCCWSAISASVVASTLAGSILPSGQGCRIAGINPHARRAHSPRPPSGWPCGPK